VKEVEIERELRERESRLEGVKKRKRRKEREGNKEGKKERDRVGWTA